MKMLRIVAAGAVSYFAYRAWKRSREEQAHDDAQTYALRDDGAHTAPHGDPILSAEEAADAKPRASAQASPGFGAP